MRGYGPKPSIGRLRQPLSSSRRAVLERLRERSEATTLAALVESCDLHPNTVREHLDALVEDGLATRRPAEPSGRGRPAWLYEPVAEGAGGSEYAGLASALAASIHRRSRHPWEDALAAGTDWGRDLAQGRDAAPTRSAAAARREVVALLDEIGFAPDADARASVVRLTRCPLLDAARKYPDVVCGVHLGIVRGALAEYGADPERTDLLPFAEPGACRLELMTRKPGVAAGDRDRPGWLRREIDTRERR